MAYIKLALGFWALVVAVVVGVAAGLTWAVVRGVRAVRRRHTVPELVPEFPPVDQSLQAANSRRYSVVDRMVV